MGEEIEMKNKARPARIVVCVKYGSSYEYLRRQTSLLNSSGLEIFLLRKTFDQVFGLAMLLADLAPRYFVVFDMDLDLVQQAMAFKLANRGHPFRAYTISNAGGIDSNLLAIQQSFVEQNFASIDRFNSRTLAKPENPPQSSSKIKSTSAANPEKTKPGKSEISVDDVSSKCSKMTFIFFDLETTGVKRDAGIIEIAAWAFSSDKISVESRYSDNLSHPDIFRRFIIPDRRINPGASKVNGIKKCGKGKLNVRGKVISNVPSPAVAMRDFLAFVAKYENVCLVAHNCIRFDAPVLCNQLGRVQIASKFVERVSYFGDTLTILKRRFPSKETEINCTWR